MEKLLSTHCRALGDWLSQKVVPLFQRLATKPWLFWPGVLLLVFGVLELTTLILPGMSATGLFLAFFLGCGVTAAIFIVIITQRAGESYNPFVLQYECDACSETFTEARLKQIYRELGIATVDLVCPFDCVPLKAKDRIEDRYTSSL
jgi:hypothetical protein